MDEDSEQGVLLYYKYVDLTEEQGAVKEWMQNLCQNLGLRGRIRVARDGINTTVSLQMINLTTNARAGNPVQTVSKNCALAPCTGWRDHGCTQRPHCGG